MLLRIKSSSVLCSFFRCGRVSKARVLAVSSSDEEVRELDISLEDLTNQNEDCDTRTEDTDELILNKHNS